MKEKTAGRKEIEKLMAELARNVMQQSPGFSAGPKKTTAGRSSEDAAREAQELVYDAWEEGSKSKRIRLARKALALYPDCADACNLLAADAARTPAEEMDYYEKGMAAGHRALGEKKFKEWKGHFWGVLDTRPYMRARAGLMQCLWEAGEVDAAIHHAKELLKLNPNDNQGIRYVLIAYLAELGRYQDLEKFMRARGYRNDCMADWLYTGVLLSFVKEGDAEKSRKELSNAMKMNAHVPKYLTGKRPIPSVLPDRIIVGGEDEAFCYASANLSAWRKVPGALDWLKARISAKSVVRGKKV
ncbi:MAG: hypothetical protein K4571_18920 [Deltaproteobacteria bacterium]